MKVIKKEDINIVLKNRLREYVGQPIMVYGTATEATGEKDGFTSLYEDYCTLQKQLLGIVDIEYMKVSAKECELFYRIGTTSYAAKIGVIIKENMFTQEEGLDREASLHVI